MARIVERSMLRRTNKERIRHRLEPLLGEHSLIRAARAVRLRVARIGTIASTQNRVFPTPVQGNTSGFGLVRRYQKIRGEFAPVAVWRGIADSDGGLVGNSAKQPQRVG